MTDHYHIVVGPTSALLPTDLVYHEYEESIIAYMGLARAFYSEELDHEEFTFEGISKEATEAEGFYVGKPSLSLVWTKCDFDPCISPSWN